MKIAAYNVMSGGFNTYTHEGNNPERLTLLQQVIKGIDADFIGLVDTFRWKEMFTTEDLKRLFDYKQAFHIDMDDDWVDKKIGIAILTNLKVRQFQKVRIKTTSSVKAEINGLHKECVWCRDKNRAKKMEDIAKFARRLVPKDVKIGYFAVPFIEDEVPDLVFSLGQDHRLLGKVFNISSPMLYHKMINKPVSYISEYVKYLYGLTNNSVLPIIQIRDMPDDLADKLSEREILSAYQEAGKLPSSGVSFFVWEHVVEKNKIGLIRKLFSSG